MASHDAIMELMKMVVTSLSYRRQQPSHHAHAGTSLPYFGAGANKGGVLPTPSRQQDKLRVMTSHRPATWLKGNYWQVTKSSCHNSIPSHGIEMPPHHAKSFLWAVTSNADHQHSDHYSHFKWVIKRASVKTCLHGPGTRLP